MLQFGEKVEGYEILVFNEREVRAAAGIVFLFAFFTFMNAILLGEMGATKLMVVGFLTDFSIRLFINPKYAPSMIVGRWMVNNQVPEYVGAPQKKWAWGFGLVLALIMFYLVILNDIRGPALILPCGLCMILLYFESVFGICIGCKVYNFFHKESAQYCPGGVCEIGGRVREDTQKINAGQLGMMLLFITIISSAIVWGPGAIKSMGLEETERDCTVPEYATGHAETWKLHNGCAEQ
jgi:hypothetical protein